MTSEPENEFRELLHFKLVPEFCGDRSRACRPEGFVDLSNMLSRDDKRRFLMGYELKLLTSDGHGRYRSPKGGSIEQFFWEGSKAQDPRRFSLWLEPILSLGALAQLHLDYDWPVSQLQAQSPDYAFDLLATKPDGIEILIAGEVKKSVRECDALINYLRTLGALPDVPKPSRQAEANAWKKAKSLRISQAPLVWIVGPNGFRASFAIRYLSGGAFEMTACGEEALRYDGL